MLRTAVCGLFNIEYPITQGGMAWLPQVVGSVDIPVVAASDVENGSLLVGQIAGFDKGYDAGEGDRRGHCG